MSNSDVTEVATVYRAYRRELLEARAVSGIRVGTIVIFAMNLAFMWLDHHAYSELFWKFFTARMLLNAMLGFVAIWACKHYPEASQVALGISTGALLLYVISGAGAVSEYYAGLLLLFCGLPMIMPFSTRQILGVCLLLVSAYAAFPIIGTASIETESYVINVAFLTSAAVISVASCYQLNRSRLTDFMQKEELERAQDHLRELDRAKSRFTANIHHELRTPLTLILAPLAALRGGEYGDLPEFIESTLKTMDVNGRRLHKLINNLLDLAKLESSQFSIERKPLNLRDLAEDVAAGAMPLAERKGLEIVVEGFENLPTLNADQDALDKVLVNLLGNALKFTDEGGRITIWAEPADVDEIRLEVRDTGIGIPPDQLAKVFDRFAQLDGSTTRKHEGTGIGLSLVQELIELHGGRIWAESEGTGCGTTVCILIPTGVADDDAEGAVLRRSDGSVVRLRDSIAATEAELNLEGGEDQDVHGPQTVEMQRSVERWEHANNELIPDDDPTQHAISVPEILVAEDNPDMRKLLAFLLSREFRVRVTRNGREALESIRESPPYLVLTDVMMPEMSGTELCAAIKGDEATRHIPVVLVTSKADREMKIEGLEIGADDYVTKPFHPRELLARVRSLVRVRDLQESLAEQNSSLEVALAELKQAQEYMIQNERFAAVGELAAGIAHEVNNPVNFALNASRALSTSVKEVGEIATKLGAIDWRDSKSLESQLSELKRLQEEIGAEDLAATMSELTEIISEGLTRTSSLVGDLREFAAPKRAQIDSVDLREGVVSTAHLLNQALDQRSASVEIEIQTDLPQIQGDAGALNQVFLNLIKNAAEASDAGGITIHVESMIEAGWLSLIFHDNGPGIDLDTQNRLFEPFFTTKPAGQGTGLGLSMSRQIAEAHNGTLTMTSTLGEGAIFTLRLPIGG